MNYIIYEGIVHLPAIYGEDNKFPAQEIIAA
jgi:hypothetical protein